MRDADGAICGVRCRMTDGTKFAVPGGREGLCVPDYLGDLDPLLICEGATDTAAALTLGFDAIGRPSCAGGVKLVALCVVRHNVKRVVIVSDSDPPGQRGAADLARELVRYVHDVRLIQPPDGVKDLRQWHNRGATRADVQHLIELADPVVTH